MQYKQNSKNKIWDLSLRCFHLALILLVIGSIVTAKLNVLEIHQFFGVALLGLIFFRILWGIIGTKYSRFKSFNLSIREAVTQFSNGNNDSELIKTPLGSYSTIMFLLVLITLSVSGLFSSDDILYDGPLAYLTPNYSSIWVYVHNISHYILYSLITIHIIAILYYQKIKKKNLIKRMFAFYFKVHQENILQKPENPLRGLAVLLLLTLLPVFLLFFY